MTITRVELQQPEIEKWSALEVLSWAFEEFHSSVSIVSAFGAEGMVLIDLASRTGKPFRVITVDTNFLFAETQTLMQQVEERYGVKIERVHPALSPQEQEALYGAALWARDPDRCCRLRKIEPLKRKLAELGAWITAIRREQTPERAAAKKLEWDTKFGLVKLNPLADWTHAQVWNYIRSRDVPYNPLHDRGYPSIGCTHCTRAALPGKDLRSGRWQGFTKTECGLHTKG